jgi:hypothetical protein
VRIARPRSALSRGDKDGIIDTLTRYARAVDDGTEGDVLEVFTDDVVIEGPLSGRHTGRDGVGAWLRSVPDRPPGQDRHIVTNIAISGTRAGANADAYFVHLRTEWPSDGSPPETRLFLAGRYECNLRRVRGRWLISRRTATIDASPK